VKSYHLENPLGETLSMVIKQRFSFIAGLITLGTAVLVSPLPGQAVTLSNGSLSVDIREDNGAIDTVLFNGQDFFNPGFPVSNWILQDSTGNFGINDTDGSNSSGSLGIPSVQLNGNKVTVTGSYPAGGSSFLERSYELLPGQNTLRTTTTLTNRGYDQSFSLADVFDPDQDANNFGTFNTVNTLQTSGSQVSAVAIGPNSGNTVTIRGVTGNFQTSFLPGSLDINSSEALDSFFQNAPYNPNGQSEDIGVGIGIRQFLANGQSLTVSFDQEYDVKPIPNPVPEGDNVAIWSLVNALLIGAFWKSRFSKRSRIS
jgi:hypothetical protein